MKTTATVLIALLLTVGCATAPEPDPISSDPELNRFARTVEQELERHAWQSLIDRAERSHYRTKVVEHGMSEPHYLAEIFGLHRVGNDISRGDRFAWADLERIRSVEFPEVRRTGSRELLIGTVTLDDGSTLELQAQITRQDGRYILTGAQG